MYLEQAKFLLITLFYLVPSIAFSESQSAGTLLSEKGICTKNACFENYQDYLEKRLKIAGSADYNYLFFKVYSAALYAEPEYLYKKEFNPLNGESSIVLLLKYHREISGSEFCESTRYYINKSRREDKDFSQQLDGLCKSYEDIKIGDSYSLVYDSKSQKSCLNKNGIEKYCASGVDFFKAYAGIWLSETGVSDEFAKKLNSR